MLGVGCSTGLSVQVRKNNISSSFISLLSLLLYMAKIILLLKLIFLLFIILITPVWIADWREEAHQQHQQHQRVHYTALSIYIFIIYLPINLFIYIIYLCRYSTGQASTGSPGQRRISAASHGSGGERRVSGASSGYTSETQEAGGRGQDHAHYKSQHWRYSFRRYSESRFRFRYSLVHLYSLSVLWKKII